MNQRGATVATKKNTARVENKGWMHAKNDMLRSSIASPQTHGKRRLNTTERILAQAKKEYA
jgi:hypothetical protein